MQHHPPMVEMEAKLMEDLATVEDDSQREQGR